MSCKKSKMTEIEVFHSIYGLKISTPEPVQVGHFRLYNYIKHKEHIKSVYFSDVMEENMDKVFGHDGCETVVSVTIKTENADDVTKAITEAHEHLERLQNILRFLLSCREGRWSESRENINGDIGSKFISVGCFDIGIVDCKQNDVSQMLVSSEGKWCAYRFYVDNRTKRLIDYSEIQSQPNKKLDVDELIKKCFREPKNEMEARLAIAIDVYGRAVYDYGKPICILEGMMAIEALLSNVYDEPISKSITAQISEYCAFLLGQTCEERICIEKRLKKLYGTRSKIAHGKSLVAPLLDECAEVMDYARSLLDVFITDDKIKKITNNDELHKHIQELKYTICPYALAHQGGHHGTT